jgi:hypothetical protein
VDRKLIQISKKSGLDVALLCVINDFTVGNTPALHNRSITKKKSNLKGKKSQGNKFVAGVLGVALLCAIHSAIIENTLFEDDDDANTFCAFNLTQIFLYLTKKLLLIRCEARTHLLIIILLRNDYFLKHYF